VSKQRAGVSREHIWNCCGTEAGWRVSNMSNSTKLVLGGIALMVIGVSAFLHSLGSGGGYGATLTFIAGAVVFMIGCFTYFLKKLHRTP
jgi:hypothetical protein